MGKLGMESILCRIVRGGNAEKLTFDWVIAAPKYGCQIEEWPAESMRHS